MKTSTMAFVICIDLPPAPTIIFFDEVDALASARGVGADSKASDRVLSQLLTGQ